MYVFKYSKKDGTEIGYHLSTFCQVGSKERAKRYGCSGGVAEQQEVIAKNLKSTLETTDKSEGFFSGISLSIKESHFKGLTFDDVVITAEEVPDVEVVRMVHTIVSKDGVAKDVNVPLTDALIKSIATDAPDGAA